MGLYYSAKKNSHGVFLNKNKKLFQCEIFFKIKINKLF